MSLLLLEEIICTGWLLSLKIPNRQWGEKSCKWRAHQFGEWKACMLHKLSSRFITTLLAIIIANCIDHKKKIDKWLIAKIPLQQWTQKLKKCPVKIKETCIHTGKVVVHPEVEKETRHWHWGKCINIRKKRKVKPLWCIRLAIWDPALSPQCKIKIQKTTGTGT